MQSTRSNRDRTLYGYATKRESRDAERRIRKNMRNLPPGQTRAWKRQGVSNLAIRRFLNFSTDAEGNERDYGDEGLSSRCIPKRDMRDVGNEVRIAHAIALKDAEMRGRRLGQQLVAQVLDSFGQRIEGISTHDPE
jgi:hypothetical protein